jgi:hypothetical protein
MHNICDGDVHFADSDSINIKMTNKKTNKTTKKHRKHIIIHDNELALIKRAAAAAGVTPSWLLRESAIRNAEYILKIRIAPPSRTRSKVSALAPTTI